MKNNNNLKKFIESIQNINSKNTELNDYVEKLIANTSPNFWEIIEYGSTIDKSNRSAHEVRYSRMIKWLLDPHENHNLKHTFARELIKKAYGSIDNLDNIFSDIDFESQDIECRTEKGKIDIYYNNSNNNTQIAIELKQYSNEHNRSNEEYSQLSYYKNLVDKVGEEQEKITGIPPRKYLIFLTPLGTAPSSDNDCWSIVDYHDITQILNHMIANNHNLDFIKIVKDFKYDLEKTGCNINFDLLKKNLPEEILTLKSQFKELFDDLVSKKEEIIIEIEKLAIYEGFNSKKIITTAEILSSILVQNQDHTPNQDVGDFMQKLLEHYVYKYGKDNLDNIEKNVRYNIFIEGMVFNQVKRTRGKGQGLSFYYVKGNKEIASTYISGDNKGVIPNDGYGVHYKLKENTHKNRNDIWFGQEKMTKKQVSYCFNNFEDFLKEYHEKLLEFSDRIKLYEDRLVPINILK